MCFCANEYNYIVNMLILCMLIPYNISYKTVFFSLFLHEIEFCTGLKNWFLAFYFSKIGMCTNVLFFLLFLDSHFLKRRKNIKKKILYVSACDCVCCWGILPVAADRFFCMNGFSFLNICAESRMYLCPIYFLR